MPDQLTKMGEGKQRNCAALYLLRKIKPVDGARYVARPLVALHSGHWERARATVATAQGSVETGAVVP